MSELYIISILTLSQFTKSKLFPKFEADQSSGSDPGNKQLTVNGLAPVKGSQHKEQLRVLLTEAWEIPTPKSPQGSHESKTPLRRVTPSILVAMLSFVLSTCGTELLPRNLSIAVASLIG